MNKTLVTALGAALFLGGSVASAQAPASTSAAATPAPVAPAPAVAAPAVTKAAGPLKLGYTNIDVLLAQMPESKDIQNQLQIQRTQAENELKRLNKEFEDKLKVYEGGAAQMSDVIKADREKELQGLQARIQEFQRGAEQQLQKKYQELVNPVIQKIQKNIDLVAKENGFTYVFNLDAGAGTTPILLFAPEDGNITDLVLRKAGVTPQAPGSTPARTGTAPTAPKK
jgi:outer membrane protein